jgi:cell wall-associated NlpC family hydrolase
LTKDWRPELELPRHFWDVPYVGSNFLINKSKLANGTNCQGFAYAVLRHFGLALPSLRSSELWTDDEFTRRVDDVLPLDIAFFNRTSEAFGAHIGICAGKGSVLHLCKAVGRPAIWPMSAFPLRPRYRVFVGVKRVVAERVVPCCNTD